MQHGFRKRRSCDTQLISTINDFAAALNEGYEIDAIFLDLSKAFDTVPHARLCQKLWHYGVRGNTLLWIKDFLSERTQRVILRGHASSICKVTSGVPQGSVLGPLLFLCYINDLPQRILSTIKLYADDSLLYRIIHSDADVTILQKDIETLYHWASLWQMSFNPSKCEFLILTNKIHSVCSQYHMINAPIKQVTSTKSLGVTIDKHLHWNEHISKITSKANTVRGFLQRNLKKCSIDTKSLCYRSLVRPILEYTCVVWSPYFKNNINKLETTQRRAARFVMNNYDKYASVTDMIKCLRWPTLEKRRNEQRILMLFKIVNQQVEIPSEGILIPNNVHTRGHNNKFRQLQTRLQCYQGSFFPDTIKLWNKLPDYLANLHDLISFREDLTKIINT